MNRSFQINDLEEQNKLLKMQVKHLEKEQERPDLQQYLRKKSVRMGLGDADVHKTFPDSLYAVMPYARSKNIFWPKFSLRKNLY